MDHLLKQNLAHVFWIGGPANSGKTTIANLVARKKRCERYSYDKHAMEHFARLSVQDGNESESPTESQQDSWANIISGAITRQTLKVFEERFPLAVQDLLAIPTQFPIIAEGIGFTPELLAPVLSSPAQAIWLIPELQFMERALRQKVKSLQLHLMKEPHKTMDALIYRDIQMVETITAQVKCRDFKMIVIDGNTSKDDIALQVLAHFNQYTAV